MKNATIGTYIYNNENIDFSFATNLTAAEKVSFVNSVVNTLIGESYNYIIKDLIFDFMIVNLFTDVDTTNINDIDAIEQFLNETNIVTIIRVNVENELFDELKKAVDLEIEYRTGVHTNSLNESLTSLFNTIEKKINNIDLNSMMEMAQKFAEMTDEFTSESIVNAYMNSDIHKNNLIEIEKSKKNKSK